MKRLISIFLALILCASALVLSSCGEAEKPEKVTPPTDSVTEKATDSATEAVTEASAKYEYEYVAPADGSCKINGVDVSEYLLEAWIPAYTNYTLYQAQIKQSLEGITASTFENGPAYKMLKNEKNLTEPKQEHEILFGTAFEREGLPEWDGKSSVYGMTENGTVYFMSPSYMMYPYMYQLFLEEFFGVALDSGEKTSGGDVPVFERAVPDFDLEALKAEGYELVFEDNFDGDTLGDAWESRDEGPSRGGFVSSSQISVADGNLVLTGAYLSEEEGAHGEGWYGATVRLKERYVRGYYEATVRCNEMTGHGGNFWSAFWLLGPDSCSWEKSRGGAGEGGSELDVLECLDAGMPTCSVWCCGADGVETENLDHFMVECSDWGDLFNEYHTFSVLWDEDYYTFYVDGKMTAHTNFANGTSPAEAEVLFSICVPDTFDIEKDVKEIMYTDSMCIWQKPEQ